MQTTIKDLLKDIEDTEKEYKAYKDIANGFLALWRLHNDISRYFVEYERYYKFQKETGELLTYLNKLNTQITLDKS